jgi:hypothetical protein
MKTLISIMVIVSLVFVLAPTVKAAIFVNIDDAGAAFGNIGNNGGTTTYKEGILFAVNSSITGIQLTHIDVKASQQDTNGIAQMVVSIENDTGIGRPVHSYAGTPIPGCVAVIPSVTTADWYNASFANCQLQANNNMYWVVMNTTSATDNHFYQVYKNVTQFYSYGQVMEWTSALNWIARTWLMDIRIWSMDTPSVLAYTQENEITETKNTYYNLSVFVPDGSTIAAQLFINGTQQTGVLSTITTNYSNFSWSGIPPYLQGEINQTNVTWWWNITRTKSTLITNTTIPSVNGSQVLNRIRILPCAPPFSNQSINMSVFDATFLTTPVQTNLSAVISAWIDSGNRTYAYTQTGKYNFTYCIYPGWANYKMSAVITYSNATSNSYIISNQSFSNTTTQISLYLLSNNISNILFTVYNNIKVPQPNVVIIAQKLFPSTGTFITVAQGQTGYDGTVTLALELGQFYQFVVQVNGVTIATIPSFQLNSLQQNLYITGNYVAMFDVLNKQLISCTPNNVTYHLVCSVTDYSGKMTQSYLTVKKFMLTNYTVTVCSLNSTSSIASFDCDLHLYNQTQMFYTFNGVFSGNPPLTMVFDSGPVFGSSNPLLNMGTTGLLLGMALVITMFFAGMMNSPTTGIALACVGLIVDQVTGLLNIGWYALIPVLITAVIVIYKLED